MSSGREEPTSPNWSPVINSMLDENDLLLRLISVNINAGKVKHVIALQERLQKNLLWLSGLPLVEE